MSTLLNKLIIQVLGESQIGDFHAPGGCADQFRASVGKLFQSPFATRISDDIDLNMYPPRMVVTRWVAEYNNQNKLVAMNADFDNGVHHMWMATLEIDREPTDPQSVEFKNGIQYNDGVPVQ